MKETIDVKKDYFRRRDEAHYLMRRIQRYNTKNDVDPRDFRKYRDHLVDHLFDYVPFYNLQNIPNNHMRSQLLILIVVLQISSSEHYVCYNQDPPTLVKLSQLQTKKNNVFHFQIHNNAAPVTIVRNNNGTFIEGAFSTLELSSQRNIYKYTSTSLSFKYPPQHRIVQISNEMVQMQILYELSSKDNSLWKHKHVGLSITFLLTEHGPAELFTIGHQINQNLKNGSILDLKELLHLIPSLNVQNVLIIDVFIQRNSFIIAFRYKFHMADTKRAAIDELDRILNFKIVYIPTSSQRIDRISWGTISQLRSQRNIIAINNETNVLRVVMTYLMF